MIRAACASVNNLGILSQAYMVELGLGLTDAKMCTSVPIFNQTYSQK